MEGSFYPKVASTEEHRKGCISNNYYDNDDLDYHLHIGVYKRNGIYSCSVGKLVYLHSLNKETP